jgi:hypothetical protein
MEQVVDSIDRYADDAAAKLDRIEEKIFTEDVSEGRVLGRIRRATVRLHRQLGDFSRALAAPRARLAQQISLDLAAARMRQRLEWLDAEIVSLRDRAHLLQEEVTMKTAEQTNRNRHHRVHAGEPDCRHLRHECRRRSARTGREWFSVVDGDHRRSVGRRALAAQALGHPQALEEEQSGAPLPHDLAFLETERDLALGGLGAVRAVH